MLVELFLPLAITLFITSSAYLAKIAYRNYQAHQFFAKKSPQLPVLPNTNLFSGHLVSHFCDKHNALKYHSEHSKYGPTYAWFYCDHPHVSTTDLDLIKTVAVDEALDHINRTPTNVPLYEFREHSLSFSKKEQWLRLRKVCAPAFSNHKVKSSNVQAEMNETIDLFMAALARRIDNTPHKSLELDVDDHCHRFVLSLVFRCFYKQPYLIDFDAEKDPWKSMMDVGVDNSVNPLVPLSVMFPVVLPLFEWVAKKFYFYEKLVDSSLGFIRELADANAQAKREIERKTSIPDSGFNKDNFIMNDGSRYRRNLMDYIVDQYQNNKISHIEFTNNTFFLFFAANKTTSDALAKLIYLLAHNQKVQDELRSSILEHGQESEYLNWCIHEALRLYPPATVGVNRVITRDIETEHGLIPAGTAILSSTFTIHRLEKYWGKEVEKYIPERWANSANFHPAQFLAFGLGKRNCLGNKFALHQMKLLMSRLLRVYRFEPSPKSQGFLPFRAPSFMFNVPDKPTYVVFTRLE